MDGYLGRRGVSLLRPVLLAIFGVFAWLVWLAGPSQAADLLPPLPPVPSVPSVTPVPSIPPSPTASIVPVPLPGPLGSLVGDVFSAIPSPSQLADTPKSLVNQLPNNAEPPAAVGIIDAVTLPVESTLGELPPLPVPALPPVPSSPPEPGSLPPSGTSVPAVFTVPLPAGPSASVPTPPDPTRILRSSPAVQTGPPALKGFLRLIPDKPVPVFPAELAMTNSSGGAVDPPADTPDPVAESPPESGSTLGPQGGSAHGAADLPEQRALLPPFHDVRVPEGRQNPAAEPAFDPGSSPD